VNHFNVLVLCRANMCRSPAAQAVLAREASTLGLDWQVDSMGVRAHVGERQCPVSRRVAPAAAEQEDFGARQLSRDAVDHHDLVLCASSAERADVARLSPAADPRTFTLLEAVGLAEALAAHLNHGPEVRAHTVLPRPQTQDVAAQCRWLVAEMHAARGLIAMPTGFAGARPWRRKWAYGIDLPDTHGSGHGEHRNVLRTTRTASERLTNAFARCLEPIVEAVQGKHRPEAQGIDPAAPVSGS
jgi:protein-tyrosine-phosphatase